MLSADIFGMQIVFAIFKCEIKASHLMWLLPRTIITKIFSYLCDGVFTDAATSPTRLSLDRDATKLQLMASMSSVGGADSLQDIWAMMESGLSPTPRHPNIDSMCILGLHINCVM